MLGFMQHNALSQAREIVFGSVVVGFAGSAGHFFVLVAS